MPKIMKYDSKLASLIAYAYHSEKWQYKKSLLIN